MNYPEKYLISRKKISKETKYRIGLIILFLFLISLMIFLFKVGYLYLLNIIISFFLVFIFFELYFRLQHNIDRANQIYMGKIREIYEDNIDSLIIKAKNPYDLITPIEYTKGSKDYQRFMIIGAPRTGSSHLVELLGSHSKVVSFSEIFHFDNILHRENIHIGYGNKLIMKLRNKDPIGFIDNLIFRPYKNKKCVGFKIFYYQFDYYKFWKLKKYFKDLKDLKIIHIKRKNLLKCYYSLINAKLTDKYAIRRPEERDLRPIYLDFNECKNYFNLINENIKKYDTYFKNREILEIFYEDLENDLNNCLFKIQKFLGLNYEALSSPYIKQNVLPLNKCIKNYYELKDKFKGTEYEIFFED